MAKKTALEALQADIGKILEEYGEEVAKGAEEAVMAVSKAGVKAVRANARSTFRGQKYASGWTSQLETNHYSAQGIIYNSKVPGLPHLLEHGHAKRGGGRVPGREHIAPVEQEIIATFEEEVASRL